MDPLKGAQMLWHRLAAEASEDAPEGSAVVVPQDALPLFHWLGVAPAEEQPERSAGHGQSSAA